MEYLIKTGSERVSQQCKENMYAVQTLKDFQYVDRDGKDQGVNVREKAKQLVALLRDEDRLREERAHALKTKEKLAQTATGEVSLPLLKVPDSSHLSSVPVGPLQQVHPFPPLWNGLEISFSLPAILLNVSFGPRCVQTVRAANRVPDLCLGLWSVQEGTSTSCQVAWGSGLPRYRVRSTPDGDTCAQA